MMSLVIDEPTVSRNALPSQHQPPQPTTPTTTKKTQQPTKHHYQKAAGRPLYRSPFTRGAADGAPFFNPFDT